MSVTLFKWGESKSLYKKYSDILMGGGITILSGELFLKSFSHISYLYPSSLTSRCYPLPPHTVLGRVITNPLKKNVIIEQLKQNNKQKSGTGESFLKSFSYIPVPRPAHLTSSCYPLPPHVVLGRPFTRQDNNNLPLRKVNKITIKR